MNVKRWIAAALAALMISCGAAAGAEELCVEDAGLVLGDCSVRYPVIAGMSDSALQDQINDQIVADTEADAYLARMSQLLSGGSLRVTWDGRIRGRVFSCSVSAEGALETARNTHRWTWSNVDLETGQEIGWEDLTQDPDALRERIGEILTWDVAPELSAHLENQELLPVPEGFVLSHGGLTLLYPMNQLSTLSGRAGAVRISWNLIRDEVNTEEGSVLDSFGVNRALDLMEAGAERIRAMTEEGTLPDLPVQLGAALKPLTDEYHLLIDPDVYEAGRLFSLEGAAFQDIQLLTDYLSESWDDSTVQGIRMNSGCVWGLCVGETARESWRSVLGQPDSEVTLDRDAADLWRVEPGTCDYYQFGSHQLRLYADQEGVLSCIILSE